MSERYLYEVISPTISRVEPILDDGSGPKEYFACAVIVKARDVLEAKAMAIRTKPFKDWRQWQEEDDGSLFQGLMARKIKERTP